MKEANIYKTIENLRKGVITRILYKSELPIKSKYKKQGISIIKITESSIRTGVKYANISSVKKRLEETVPNKSNARKNNVTWVIPNKISHNNNTNKDYFYVAPIRRNANVSLYLVKYKDKTLILDELNEEVKEYIIDSYLNNKHIADVKTIDINNIIRINKEYFQNFLNLFYN